MIKKVRKRDGTIQEYQVEKIKTALLKALNEVNEPQWKTQCFDIDDLVKEIQCEIEEKANKLQPTTDIDTVGIEFIQDCVEDVLMDFNLKKTAKAYIIYRHEHKRTRDLAQSKLDFVKNYMKSDNTANATIDDNSNVKGKNVGIMNAEIHKQENINTNRYMVMKKLNELYPDFDAKQYVRDLKEGIIYKHDESSSNTGATMPYCCSISLYPFLNDGLKNIGGLSAAPKNLDSFCGMYCNLIFCIAGQFLGAVATSEVLVYFDMFARKDWGDDYYKYSNSFYKIGYKLRKLLNKSHYWTNDVEELSQHDFGSKELNDLRDEIVFESNRPLTEEELKEYYKNIKENPDYTLNLGDGTRTIRGQIHQYFQQITYTINQSAANRGMQSAFTNFSYFDKDFFEGMFGTFYFPDGSRPIWESVQWLQEEYMHWFNQERLKTMLTFPVESTTLLYKDGKFTDERMLDFIAKEYAEGHSMFTYISSSVDSLSSCCFSKDTKVLWKSSTIGVQLTTLEELHNLKWEPYKKNLKIFHNGSWIKGKSIKLQNRDMYEVTTFNNKKFVMTDNHINITFDGEKETSKLTTEDYLMFNTLPLQAVHEKDENLTYAEGILLGAYLGDGTISGYICQDGSIHAMDYSLNKDKYEKLKPYLDQCMEKYNMHYNLNTIYNNVYPVKVYSKEFVAFIEKWGNWKEHTTAVSKDLNLNVLLQSYEFRKGILDGWYITDGGNSNRCYTVSEKLKDAMEVLITSLGYQSIIDISDRTEEEVIIRGESFNRNYPLYCVRWYVPDNHRVNKDKESSWIKKNNSIYFKIKSIEKINYTEDVYCIECNNTDEPYFTLPSGLITHNCRLKNKIQTKEFNFTNGNMGVETGSKSVISLNLNRIIQNWSKEYKKSMNGMDYTDLHTFYAPQSGFKEYLIDILERVYKYHTAYNELLWDMYSANLLPVYSAGFLHLNKQYLTIGIIGLTAAAEFMGIEISDNPEYKNFVTTIFKTIKEQNLLHKTKKTNFNTECVPAESAGAKLYNKDKKDGYWIPSDINLYTSYMFKPYDSNTSVLTKFILHGKEYIGDYLDGGASNHVNLDSHLSKEQYKKLIKFAAENGCEYFGFNIPNAECDDCGFIAKQPFDTCPKCGSTNVSLWDRPIGYLSKVKNWSKARQIERKTRVYTKEEDIKL